MFTGIIEAKGRVLLLKKTIRGSRLVVQVPAVFVKLRPGTSVSVNGACLTVSGRGPKKLSFDLLNETMKHTAFKYLDPGASLNLERALQWNKRIEGHFVQGHVDGVGRVLKVLSKPRESSFQISFPHTLKRFFIEKASVAVNGVSLTIGKAGAGAFWVHGIPVTLKKTNLGELEAGDFVNLEADILLKSFRRLTSARSPYKLSGFNKTRK